VARITVWVTRLKLSWSFGGDSGGSRLDIPSRVERLETGGIAWLNRQARREITRELPVQRAPLRRDFIESYVIS